MTQPKNRSEVRDALIKKIHRLQRRGENADRQIAELARMMKAEQNQRLRILSNRRFGRKRARQLRKTHGDFAFEAR